MRGGDTGPVVIPGNPDDSLLLAKIERATGRRCRPAADCRRRPVALIRAWIAGGAPP